MSPDEFAWWHRTFSEETRPCIECGQTYHVDHMAEGVDGDWCCADCAEWHGRS